MQWLLLVVGLVLAQDPIPVTPAEPIPAVQPKVVFPVVPVPNLDPPVVPNAEAPFVLLPGRLFVVQSNAQFFLRASPVGIVSIKQLTGPRDFYGKFADEGPDEDRTYQSKYLAVVRVIEGRGGDVTLTSIPVGITDENQITDFLIRIGVAPRPPPKPDVPVIPVVEPEKPRPKPDEPVVPSDQFKLLIQTITVKYANLPAADRVGLAAAFREASKQVTDGKVTTMQQLTKVTSDLIVEKIGLNNYFAWVPWRDDVTKALRTQNFATPKDNVQPWGIIADVLLEGGK